MKEREDIIKNYLEGYNKFDIQKMTKDFSDDITFENIQNGMVNMTLNGIEEFIKQAETAKQLFLERNQTILSVQHKDEYTEIEIDYVGVLATDLPNGFKKGQELKLKGKSKFEFKNDKVIKLTDES